MSDKINQTTDPRGASRRRFLQGTIGTILASSLLSRFAPKADAAEKSGRAIGAEAAVPTGTAMPYKIGVAAADVTPTWPVRMAGFSFRKDKLSDGIYENLFVRAMSINDGKQRVVYVMGDICYWDRRGGPPRPGTDPRRGTGQPLNILKPIQEELKTSNGLRPDQVVFVASHTHSGPALNDEKFKSMLIQQTIKCVKDAIAAEREARLFFGRGSTTVGKSRRAQLIDGEDAWQISPYSAHDREVVVVKAVDRAGKPIGLMFNYGCHPTTIGTQQIGGDYAGFAAEELKKRLSGATAMFLQGCGGDGKTDNPQPGHRFLFISPTRATVDQPKKLGKQLAEDVINVLRKGEMEEISGPVRVGSATVDMPVLSAWDGEQWIDKRTKFDPADPLSGPRRRMARMAKWIMDSMNANGEYKVTVTSDIYCVRIGDKFIHVGLSGEICSPYGLRIKDQLRGNNVMVTGYTGPMHGYVPGMAQIPYGGYEVFTNPNRKPYSPEVEDMIVCDAMELIETIGPKIPLLEPAKEA